MEVAHNLHCHIMDGGYTLVKILPPAGEREYGQVGVKKQILWQGCNPVNSSQDQGVLDNVVHQVVSWEDLLPIQEELGIVNPKEDPVQVLNRRSHPELKEEPQVNNKVKPFTSKGFCKLKELIIHGTNGYKSNNFDAPAGNQTRS
ncbi:hypothetical protein DSO57_1032219 [Entomophthora muscae]|uniref:Uncharacterized protein n=1 Tax=Entomophthora muscae TaxID=34485 RepID=A0ACC2TZJ0_9FUNG|nr:hypothetical protein DSO57_1032219 [Entomophthora muscae]